MIKIMEHIYEKKFNSDWEPPKLGLPNDRTCYKRSDGEVSDRSTATLQEIITNSQHFNVKFPINSVRCTTLKDFVPIDQLEKNINSTYPIVHEGTLELYSKFLDFKRNYGSDVEKSLYDGMDIAGLVSRLLLRRAVSFWGPADKYLLLNNEEGSGKWDTIGTSFEKHPLVLQNLISYDEIKLSALLYVSGYNQFINDGNRQNCGIPAKNKKDITENGVVIGLIGARLKKKQVMEYEEIIVTKEQNNAKNGYTPCGGSSSSSRQKWRQMWADFYDEPINSYETTHSKVVADDISKMKNQFSPAKAKNAYFDNFYYKKRLILTIDTLLIEANHRAKAAGKMAYIHMVGIGLGVWRNADHQETTFLEVFSQRLRHLKGCIRNISDVHFAYFKLPGSNEITNGKMFPDNLHPNGGVLVHVSKREPSSKLEGVENEQKLLIVTYAWDGNAQPGNEFWMGKLKSSGDPAAACSCQVSELHNAHINKSNVCGSNLHVASREHGVVHFSQYLNILSKEKSK